MDTLPCVVFGSLFPCGEFASTHFMETDIEEEGFDPMYAGRSLFCEGVTLSLLGNVLHPIDMCVPGECASTRFLSFGDCASTRSRIMFYIFFFEMAG